MADPLLHGQFPVRGLYQALAVAAMCVQEQATMRPQVSDLVTALTYLASQKFNSDSDPVRSSRFAPGTPPPSRRDATKNQIDPSEVDQAATSKRE